MIIVSQDKNVIINFENVNQIGVEKEEKNIILAQIDFNTINELGVYETEARAKEVLKEITQRYIHTPYKKYGNDYIKQNQIYEMPKE